METFIYGFLTAIGIIAFLIWGFLSVLGNEMNPASWLVGNLMSLASGRIPKLFKRKKKK